MKRMAKYYPDVKIRLIGQEWFKQNLSACGACGTRFSEWLPSMPGEVFDHKYVYDENP